MSKNDFETMTKKSCTAEDRSRNFKKIESSVAPCDVHPLLFSFLYRFGLFRNRFGLLSVSVLLLPHVCVYTLFLQKILVRPPFDDRACWISGVDKQGKVRLTKKKAGKGLVSNYSLVFPKRKERTYL